MGDPIATGRGNVPVSHHQFHIADTGVGGEGRQPSRNGLVATGPGIVIVLTGIGAGVVDVFLEVHDSQPKEPDADEWDEIVETDLYAPIGRAVITGLGADAPEFPVLSSAGVGNYRIRVHAKGRDTAIDLVRMEPVERYLILVWPSAPSGERVYKQRDRFGETMRRAAQRAAAEPDKSDPVIRARDALLQRMRERGEL